MKPFSFLACTHSKDHHLDSGLSWVILMGLKKVDAAITN